MSQESYMDLVGEPNWVTYDQVVALHNRLLRRFGGAPGLRDDVMLRSALERLVNKWHYEQTGLSELAAAYAFGLAKNHAFVDGNKRLAFMTMTVFLRRNDVLFAPDQARATAIIMSLGAGEVSEGSLARWIRDNRPRPAGPTGFQEEPAALYEGPPLSSSRPPRRKR
jgi:death-on-curing protein